MYMFALAIGRSADAERELAWAKGKPEEYHFLSAEARALQEQGKLKQSMKRAVELEKSQKLDEVAASEMGTMAATYADFGVCGRALQAAGELTTNPTRDTSALLGSAFATCGQELKAEGLAADLSRKYPLETYAQKVDIPMIKARQALQRGDGVKALEYLRSAESCELGFQAGGVPAYLRGLAYLQLKQGDKAAAEFQKLVDHKAVISPSPMSGLAKLGIARKLAISGDSAKARTAYQDFFASWKDADPDLPILHQAKAEYAKLQ